MREALNAALSKWAAITGDASGQIRNWHYEVSLKDLNEAQELDPSGLTAAMLLVAIWEQFSSAKTINVQQVLRQDHLTRQTLAEFRDCRGCWKTQNWSRRWTPFVPTCWSGCSTTVRTRPWRWPASLEPWDCCAAMPCARWAR